METTRALRQEHRVILRVLDGFEIALGDARRDGSVAAEVFEPFLEFFRGFADACHHCKEEDRLFPCLERCGVPRQGGPIGVMLHEHELGRAHVRAMAGHLPPAAAGDKDAAAGFLDEGTQFLGLLRQHIMKEDHVLFDMADAVVGDPERASLVREYAAAESDPAYVATYERTRRIADEIAVRFGLDRQS